MRVTTHTNKTGRRWVGNKTAYKNLWKRADVAAIVEGVIGAALSFCHFFVASDKEMASPKGKSPREPNKVP